MKNVIWNGIKTTWKRSKDHKKTIILVVIVASLQSILSPVTHYVFGLIVTSLTSNASMVILNYTIPLVVVLLTIWAVLQLANTIASRNRRVWGSGLGEEIKQEYKYTLMQHLLMLPLGFHKNEKRGEISEIVTRASQGTSQISQNLFLNTFPEVFGIIATLLLALTVKPIFLIIFLISIVIYIYSIFRLNRPAAALQRRAQYMYKIANGYAEDLLNNIRSIKDFAKEKESSRHMYQLFVGEGLPAWKKLWKLRHNTILVQELILLSSRVLCLSLSLYFIMNGEMTIGEIVIVNMFALRMYDPVKNLSDIWKEVENGCISIEEAEELLKLAPERVTDSEITRGIRLGDVTFNNISFGYNAEQEILRNISFTANAGERIAIVGESGVGKSTLIELLLGYYAPSEGEILIDGQSLDDINLIHLRNSIALVNQESILFNDTIKNNLLYAKNNATEDELETAARKAHILSFIQELPDKWDQVVGERGIKLSVGQKQRMAIARAILRNPKILILDEPTSALDAGTEKVITDMLEKEMVGRTTLIIAHRLSTVRKADKIIVLKGGEVVETGTHEELIKIAGGEYKCLHDLQIGLHD